MWIIRYHISAALLRRLFIKPSLKWTINDENMNTQLLGGLLTAIWWVSFLWTLKASLVRVKTVLRLKSCCWTKKSLFLLYLLQKARVHFPLRLFFAVAHPTFGKNWSGLNNFYHHHANVKIMRKSPSYRCGVKIFCICILHWCRLYYYVLMLVLCCMWSYG